MNVYKDGCPHEGNFENKIYEKGIFGNGASPESRIINYEQIAQYVEALKTLNLDIVLTSGTFDLTHIGHAKYLEKAKSFGDILIVGIDSDEKVRQRKGPERPVVNENERALMIASLRSTDIITIKNANEAKWGLIKTIRPDTLVVTEETYNEEQLKQLSEFCGRVVCLEPQATTSTSAEIRKLRVGWADKIINPIEEICRENGASDELIHKLGKFLLDHKNG